MKDLEREQLKKSFKENILYALKQSKNVVINIAFVFKGTHQGMKFRYREHITYFANDFTYKNVSFTNRITNTDTIIDMILYNFSYDHFSFIKCKEKFGGVKCHGFGDYWGKDEFTFIYERKNCI